MNNTAPSCPGLFCDQDTGIALGYRIWQPDYECVEVRCPYGCRVRTEEEREEDRAEKEAA